MEHLDWINDELTILAEAFGETLTEQRQEIYCSGLADIPRAQQQVAFLRARYELKWFPKLAELRELAGVWNGTSNDGRPGPEEAWARMPKGERMEDDSVVWCEEERIAYGACRSLLIVGDQIGARMAFKECYERELAQARSKATPVQWTISIGFDVEHRLATLANAVQDKRLSLDDALKYVPGERRDNFALMLPPAHAKGLLPGKVRKEAILPGLPGLLEKMRMDGSIPEELQPAASRSSIVERIERSSEEWRQLRDQMKAQLEGLIRSRGASNNGS